MAMRRMHALLKSRQFGPDRMPGRTRVYRRATGFPRWLRAPVAGTIAGSAAHVRFSSGSTMSIHPVALGCTAILGLLLFGLGLGVSVTRFRQTTGCGCAPDPTNVLHKIVRAHGNTAEYAPFLAVLFLYFGAHDPSRAILALIVAATACRCLLVVGLLAWPTMSRPNPLRFIGAFGTYLCGAALSVALFV
jgi:uncharacterized membrane protein YecN with MAPEG domain